MDTETIIRLRRIVGRLARQLNTSSTSEGLTPSQASVLGLIVARGPLSLAALTELERLNPTMLSRVVGRLGEQELITREPDPADARAVSVRSTAKGRKIDANIKKQRAAIVGECVERLPADQLAALEAALPALEALSDEVRTSTGR
ncbi:MAG TPA: MarR family winged helix-turn-helix transcriptional regulator [Mycobacteriales bacterium]|nr:MarR family winged helix-turn-helix transcriptional regulator [Mycobacteriales bacterium]